MPDPEVSAELRIISDKLAEIKNQSEKIKDLEAKVTSLNTTSSEVKQEVSALEKKTPPLATLFAAGAIVLAATGGSLWNTISIGGEVENINGDISEIRKEVEKIPSEFEDKIEDLEPTIVKFRQAANDFNEGFNNLQTALNKTLVRLDENTGNFTTKLELQLSQLSKLDTRVSELITRLEVASRLAPSAETEMSSADSLGVLGILDAFGDQLPPEMRYIRDAEVLSSQGRYAAARAKLLDAKEIDPDDNTAFYDAKIAETYLREEEYSLAESHYLSAINSDPNIPALYNNLSSVYFSWAQETVDETIRDERHQKAIDVLKEGIDLPEANQDTMASNMALSFTELSNPNFSEALKVLEAYRGQSTHEIDYSLARVYALADQKSNMIIELGRLIEKNPTRAILVLADEAFDQYSNDPDFRALVLTIEGAEILLE